MRKILAIFGLFAVLTGCESMYDNDGIPRIRSQADAAAYNATVSSEGEKLVCIREAVLGSNLRRFVCATVAQRERMQEQAKEDVRFIGDALSRNR